MSGSLSAVDYSSGATRAWCGDSKVLVALDADVVILTEITAACSPPLAEALFTRGWHHVRATTPPQHEYGVLIASRTPLVQRALDEGPAPHRALMVDVEGSNVAIFGGYLPLPKQGQRRSDLQRRFWGWLLPIAERLRNDALLVAGDFNTCLGVDGAGRDLPAAEHLARLHGLGYRDTFRALHPEAVAHSWWYRNGQGFRIDHVHASPGFSGVIRWAAYVLEVDGRRLAWNCQGPRPDEVISDHAGLLLEIA